MSKKSTPLQIKVSAEVLDKVKGKQKNKENQNLATTEKIRAMSDENAELVTGKVNVTIKETAQLETTVLPKPTKIVERKKSKAKHRKTVMQEKNAQADDQTTPTLAVASISSDEIGANSTVQTRMNQMKKKVTNRQRVAFKEKRTNKKSPHKKKEPKNDAKNTNDKLAKKIDDEGQKQTNEDKDSPEGTKKNKGVIHKIAKIGKELAKDFKQMILPSKKKTDTTDDAEDQKVEANEIDTGKARRNKPEKEKDPVKNIVKKAKEKFKKLVSPNKKKTGTSDYTKDQEADAKNGANQNDTAETREKRPEKKNKDTTIKVGKTGRKEKKKPKQGKGNKDKPAKGDTTEEKEEAEQGIKADDADQTGQTTENREAKEKTVVMKKILNKAKETIMGKKKEKDSKSGSVKKGNFEAAQKKQLNVPKETVTEKNKNINDNGMMRKMMKEIKNMVLPNKKKPDTMDETVDQEIKAENGPIKSDTNKTDKQRETLALKISEQVENAIGQTGQTSKIGEGKVKIGVIQKMFNKTKAAIMGKKKVKNPKSECALKSGFEREKINEPPPRHAEVTKDEENVPKPSQLHEKVTAETQQTIDKLMTETEHASAQQFIQPDVQKKTEVPMVPKSQPEDNDAISALLALPPPQIREKPKIVSKPERPRARGKYKLSKMEIYQRMTKRIAEIKRVIGRKQTPNEGNQEEASSNATEPDRTNDDAYGSLAIANMQSDSSDFKTACELESSIYNQMTKPPDTPTENQEPKNIDEDTQNSNGASKESPSPK